MKHPTVAVCEVDLPPGVAFLRSLGRAGVPVRAYGQRRVAAGRFSRYGRHFGLAPDAHDTDAFHRWLDDVVERDGIALVAPTSDYVVAAVAEYDHRCGTMLGGPPDRRTDRDALLDCLHKDRFAMRLDELGMPQPRWRTGISADDVDDVTFPLVVKPTSHVITGIDRGVVAGDRDELDRALSDGGADDVIVQELIDGDEVSIVSMSGFADADGHCHGVVYMSKVAQWGTQLGIGTEFEVIDTPWYDADARRVVSEVLGCGLFELEIITDWRDRRFHVLELNPRGYGQIALSIARGADLPRRWYAHTTGVELPAAPSPRRAPSVWRLGWPRYAGIVVDLLLGPDRRSGLRHLAATLRRRPATPMFAWDDPGPGLAFSYRILRHPGGLVKPFVGTDRNR